MSSALQKGHFMIAFPLPVVTRSIAALALSICLLFLVGCARTAEGKWKASTSLRNGTVATQGMEFQKDGTVTQTVTLPTGSVRAIGTYKPDGSILFTQIESIRPSGSVSGQAHQEATYRIEGNKIALSSTDRSGKSRSVTYDRSGY